MYRRISITLPEEVVRLIDRISGKSGRGDLVDTAVRRYVARSRRSNLRKSLKEGARQRAKRDLQVAEEFFLSE